MAKGPCARGTRPSGPGRCKSRCKRLTSTLFVECIYARRVAARAYVHICTEYYTAATRRTNGRYSSLFGGAETVAANRVSSRSRRAVGESYKGLSPEKCEQRRRRRWWRRRRRRPDINKYLRHSYRVPLSFTPVSLLKKYQRQNPPRIFAARVNSFATRWEETPRRETVTGRMCTISVCAESLCAVANCRTCR